MYRALKRKIIRPLLVSALTIPLIIILMSLLGWFYFTNFQHSLNETTKSYLNEITTQNAKAIEDKINKDFALMKSMASLVTEENGITLKNIVRILKKEVKENSFKRMGLIYLGGKAITTDDKIFYLGDRAFFKKALKSKTTVSDTLVDKVDGKKINVYATPVYEKEKVVAVLFGTKDNEDYRQILSVPTIDPSSFAYLVKQNGSMLVKTNKVMQKSDMKNLFSNNVFASTKEARVVRENMAKLRSGMVLYRSLSTGERYLTYAPLKINDWYVVTSIPKKALTKEYDEFILFTLAGTVGTILLFLCIFLYTSSMQKEHSKALEKIAYIDEVTGGASWTYFKLTASEIIKDSNFNYAFFSFDIDKFKIVNDVFGIKVGDNILTFIVKTIERNIDKNELVAHITADNFAVLLTYDTKENLTQKIESLIKDISCYHVTAETTYIPVISGGVYEIKNKEIDFDTVYNRSVFAKNMIKPKAESSYAFYDEAIRARILYQNQLEADMQAALNNGNFLVYLQPKYSLDNNILGAEALVRWKHHSKGIISPLDFIPLFEKNGFISKLDLYMFEQVCIKIRQWIDEGKTPIVISVNLSRVNFHNPNIVETLLSIVKKYNLNPAQIELEVTESAVFENIDELIQVIDKMRSVGFPISIDDFGTGYSSLNLLKDLEVDVLKLDQEFFKFSRNVERSKKVVKNVILMAKDLHIKTVSEGVETLEHVDFLKLIGCDLAQGYYFSKPLPVAEFEELLFGKKTAPI